jgi:hypothetical protein
MDAVEARERLGDLLERISRAVQPAKPPGAAMGSWDEQWGRVQLRAAPDRGHLRGTSRAGGNGWRLLRRLCLLRQLPSLSGLDCERRQPPALDTAKSAEARGRVERVECVCGLANRSKHSELTHRTWTGDPSTGPSGNDVALMVGQGARHAFRVSSRGVELDALDLASACVMTWRAFLAARGLP